MSRHRCLFQIIILLVSSIWMTATLAARPAEPQGLPDFRKLVKQNEATVVKC